MLTSTPNSLMSDTGDNGNALPPRTPSDGESIPSPDSREEIMPPPEIRETIYRDGGIDDGGDVLTPPKPVKRRTHPFPWFSCRYGVTHRDARGERPQ